MNLMAKNTFDNIFLVGRGGCGKSELIDFLKKVPEKVRSDKYHISAFEELDDFPWLHTMLKDEDIWEEMGYPRKLGKRKGHVYLTQDYNIYEFLLRKFNVAIKEKFMSDPEFYKRSTLFIEFARGRENAYKHAFSTLNKEILSNSAIFYLDNTFEESLRRNEVRSTDNDTNQTILNHKVPVEVMEYLYKTHDWYDLTDKEKSGYIEAQGLKIPFVTVWNMPETNEFKTLEERYGPAFKSLWDLYKEIHT